ncbi:MAG: hypothetical protein R6U32_06335 [Candidatus Woesearchaeota archaeon]
MDEEEMKQDMRIGGSKDRIACLSFAAVLMLAVMIMISGCEGEAQPGNTDQEMDESGQGGQQDAGDGQEGAGEDIQGTDAADSTDSEGSSGQDDDAAEDEAEPEGFLEEEFELQYNLAQVEDIMHRFDYLIGADAPSADVVTVTELNTLYISRGVDTGDALLTNEVDDYKEDFIIVGSPCDNPAAAELFRDEIEDKGTCEIFPEGEGVLKLQAVTNNDIIFYIGGNTADDTRRAAEVMKYPNQHDLDTTEVRVTGTVGSPQTRIIE